MCDFSSKGYSRPAKVGDKLVTRDFGIGTRGLAIFRQVNRDKPVAQSDALEFPDGRTVLLTHLCEGQGGNSTATACAAGDSG
jgi:hypothetical protein